MKTVEDALLQALPTPPAGLLLVKGADGVMRTAEGIEVSPDEQAAWLEDEKHVLFEMPAREEANPFAEQRFAQATARMIAAEGEPAPLPPVGAYSDSEHDPKSTAQPEVPDAPPPDLPPILARIPVPLGRGQAMPGGIRLYESGRDIPKAPNPNAPEERRATTSRR